MFRNSLAAVLAVGFALLMTACGGGDDEGAADAVRTLETDDSDDASDEELAAEDDVAEEFSIDANEAAAAANAVPGDTDGDGVLSEAERIELLNSLFLEFSQCVRDEGVEDFEDITIEMFADSNGQGPQRFFQLMIERGVNPGTDAGQNLLQACSSILSQLASNAPQPSDEQIAAREAAAVDWAACLREQGIEDFPDPDFIASPEVGYGPELQQQYDFGAPPLSDAAAACAEQGRTLFSTGS
jgi:hypothetical protein